jgi:superfamily II DNA helicase RecQ
MQFKKFVVSVHDSGAQEEDLNKFLKSHRILKVDSSFVPTDGYWAFMVSYQEGEPAFASPVQRSNTEKPDPEKELSPEQYQRYKKFAEVRLDLSKQERLRAFMVFTNAELIQIAKMEEPTVARIAAIHGVGADRAERYGKPMIESLATLSEAPIATIPSEPTNETTGVFDAADSGF